MEKYNELILLVHPLWNEVFDNTNSKIYHPRKVKLILNTEEKRIAIKTQITTYLNTVLTRLNKNPNARAIIFFPKKEMLKNEDPIIEENGLKLLDIYNELVKEPFLKKIKPFNSIETTSWFCENYEPFAKLKIKSTDFERNLKLTLLGEQYKEHSDYAHGCVAKVLKRMDHIFMQGPNRARKNVSIKVIKNATLGANESFKSKIQKINIERNKPLSKHLFHKIK